jgi:hypothetical protein
MIKIIPTQEQISRAQELFDFRALKNSITQGDGNLAGALGEIIVCDHYQAEQKNTYDYDLVMRNHDGEETTVDVKTKRISPKLKPSPNWFATVAASNTSQNCDYYCFVGVATDFSTAYIYGFYPKEEFYEKSIFGKKGDVDPYGDGIFTFRADCYNLFLKDLLL